MAVMPLRLARAVRGVRRNLPYKSQTASSDARRALPIPRSAGSSPLAKLRHGRLSDRAGGAHSFGGLRAVLDLIGRAGRKEQRGIELGASPRSGATLFSIESVSLVPSDGHAGVVSYQLSLWR